MTQPTERTRPGGVRSGATRLNQVVAIERDVKGATAREIDAIYKLVQKPQLLSGISRTYQPKDEDGDQLPPESTLVQVTLNKLLAGLAANYTRLLDMMITKDAANMKAKADIVVGTETLATDVPVITLLAMDKMFVDLHTEIAKMPVLDPAEEWAYDRTSGVYRSTPAGTVKTKKVPRNHVKAPATDKHPAQVEMYYEDVMVGTWTTVKFSGALPADRKEQLLERVQTLREAIKYARERANSIQVETRELGGALFTYLLAD